MKPLTVYKASAGSGKTFTLAVEYIKLLIENPFSFRNILAVTFTNKATEEMKMRILSQLYGIWKLLPDSEVYITEVTGKLGISRQQASRQAGIALNALIHNYNYFRVETIDSFFQSILRNLARELDLTANLKIGLNDKQVEEQAVDNLIESLSTKSVMLQWLISYIFSNISDNKSWNVIGQVKDFGKNIFQDYYKDAAEKLNNTLSDSKFFDKYTKQLRSVRENAKKKMAEHADEFERKTLDAGLQPDSYKGKNRGICSYFRKLRSDDFSSASCVNSTLKNCMEDAANWTTAKDTNRDIILSLVNGSLMKLLHEAESERQKQWELYLSADVTLRHLNKLRLLNSIDAKVRELNAEANRFLLSDTQKFLKDLIQGNDSPFIFEKIGCQLEHIMIDEFQDTSKVQWENFKILLDECMSHWYGESTSPVIRNLIVGDVKQSIYRWRSGDWQLLNGIENQFKHPQTDLEVHSLQTNYRSERNVIDFNNAFFSFAAKNEYEQELNVNEDIKAKDILTAYADVTQNVREGKDPAGLVKITLLPQEDYEDSTLATIEQQIDDLLNAGIPQNKIALLIRYNKHIPLIADYFMENRPELRIVSDEAFRLDASLPVNIIIQALSLLIHPDDILAKANLAVTYQRRILGSTLTDSDMLTGTDKSGEKLDLLLPNAFVSMKKDILRKPLIDIIEHIYSSFQLNKLENQSAYICAFYDKVTSFINDNSGNIDKFLSEWNESICNSTIQSDEVNGIRIISIHKSKGLEFDNVIIPFCDWALEGRNNTLWCNPEKEPFSRLDLVPVDYNKKLLDTIYAKDYRDEHIQNSVDNLNLLYVAFTRAGKNLFIIGKKSAKPDKKDDKTNKARTRSEVLYKSLPDLCNELKGSTLTDDSPEEPTVFEYGGLFVPEKKEEKESRNVFLQKATQQTTYIETHEPAVQFRQSNKSRDFIENNDADEERDRYIKTGSILHKLFSMISTSEDIDSVLKQLEFDGVLYDDNITSARMKEMLAKRLADKRVAEWFDPRWKVFNECSILTLDKATNKVVERRPDRVITDGKEMIVIDFKFGKPCEEYVTQVRNYMSLLKSMGYGNIKGFLWFVYSNKIEEVNMPGEKAE